MKGVVFTEFMELVEGNFGMQVADCVVTKGCPFHQNGFTSVGNYNHEYLINMVSHLSKEVNLEANDLVHAFGRHLFASFSRENPHYTDGVDSTFDLLLRVERVIHVEVRKLHPDAELPHFKFPPADEGCMNIEYISSRPFAQLCHGLIEASIEHFGEDLEIVRTDLEGAPGTHALFSLMPTTSYA